LDRRRTATPIFHSLGIRRGGASELLRDLDRISGGAETSLFCAINSPAGGIIF
jgi:hypothetical protein